MPGDAALVLLADAVVVAAAEGGDHGGELGGGGGGGHRAELGFVDDVDDAADFADFAVGESAGAEGGVHGGHFGEGAGDADVFAGDVGGHGAGPGEPVGDGFEVGPVADGAGGVEFGDEFEQGAGGLGGEGGGGADLSGEPVGVGFPGCFGDLLGCGAGADRDGRAGVPAGDHAGPSWSFMINSASADIVMIAAPPVNRYRQGEAIDHH